MTHKREILAAFALLGLLVALAGCSTTAATDERDEALELRTYKVPPGLETDVRSMLVYALGPSEAPVGRVRSGPGGTLVVVAPKSIHDGVAQLIEELRSLESEAAEPVPVKLTYWLVVGRPAPDLESGFRTAEGSRLGDVSSVLEEISRSQGPMEFQLLERLQLASAGEDRATLSGSLARIDQHASVIQDTVVADVQIRVTRVGVVETRIKLEPAQFLVLGQAGFRDAAGGDPTAVESIESTLYYVITSDLES